MVIRTPEALLDAAESLFTERGYDGVGIRDIAERAGANIAAIRYHFGGKRELYLEAVRRAMARRPTFAAWQILEDEPSGRRDAAIRLTRFIREFLVGILGDPRAAACGLILQHEASNPSAALDDVLSDYFAPHLEALERTIDRIDAGRSPVELARLAHLVMGMLLHHHHQRVFIERLTGSSLERGRVQGALAEEIARFTLRGLRAGEAFIERVLADARAEVPPRSGSNGTARTRSKSKGPRAGARRRSAPKGTSS